MWDEKNTEHSGDANDSAGVEYVAISAKISMLS